MIGRAAPIGNNVLSFEKRMLLKKIEQVTDLPVPNVHLIGIVRMMRGEDVDVKALVEAIEKDQSLVAKLLRLINSGFYSLKKSVDTVDRAVGLLGLSKIKEIVYSASVMDLFSEDEKKDWEHAYSCSVLMGELIKQNGLEVTKSLPLAMLMHDIGKLVLKRFNPQKYNMALLKCKSERKPLHVEEEAVLQISHAEAASVLMSKWEMDEDIVIPVMFHHSDAPPQDHIVETALVQIVNWVDNMARELPGTVQPSKAVLQVAGLDTFDKMAYINYQRHLISQIEASEAKARDAGGRR